LALLRAGVDSVETLADQAGSPVHGPAGPRPLERDGSIARTYGGALVRDEVFHERPFGVSAHLDAEAKAAIAARAVELVPAEGTVFLDAGTTCLALARLLGAAGR
jgi:DeoR/GlpR family transcriptional regulator of sugar metabolism